MEELDLKELFNIFWNRKLYIILIILVFVVIGLVYTTKYTKPLYSSSTTLVLVSTSNNNTTGNNTVTAGDITLNSRLVTTYSKLIKSKNVMKQVISNLSLQTNENSLRNRVSVNSVERNRVNKNNRNK